MNYEYIENITSADIAVRVKAPSLSLLFLYGAEALVSETIEDLSSINKTLTKQGTVSGDDIELLYSGFLNEILFLRDSEQLILAPEKTEITLTGNICTCNYVLKGERINSGYHKFRSEIKAVTLHGLKIYKDGELYIAESVFDV